MKTVTKATAKKMPHGMVVETKARKFTIMMDEPKAAGGTDESATPTEHLLCALGACQTIVAFTFAESQGIKLDDFYVEIEGDIDYDGLRDIAPIRKGFLEIRYKMHFKTNSPREEVEKFAVFVEQHCPVGDSLANGVPMKCTGIVIE
ncbi:peroxiredoxin [Candidatus Epulonipiscium fishelsonii]|uniref:Peroxiredoxin n=1 Tax=Candidatus Epulonipiscium fishelsonii TaxID=77094 RepID=A0ACC8XD67_9FIRM|nr:peroxiredoxin [Epulopiscium sp. SCG-B05WGA-EpuloA1]ONI40781.1 peroxiredoxin [Epulopiscium sp. SCG-B11WGA-EpuloA1]ONI47084.1 peroxiredoxin [Epulopiscium sp. SCG-C06WGA-EpuloA1]